MNHTLIIPKVVARIWLMMDNSRKFTNKKKLSSYKSELLQLSVISGNLQSRCSTIVYQNHFFYMLMKSILLNTWKLKSERIKKTN